jgi:hypothetical protein
MLKLKIFQSISITHFLSGAFFNEMREIVFFKCASTDELLNCVYLNFCALLFLWKFISSPIKPSPYSSQTFLLHESFSLSSLPS